MKRLVPLLLVQVCLAGSFSEGRLANGLRYALYSDPSAELAATQLWVEVGSAHEARGQYGLAHLFEHLMFGPTANLENRAYERYIDGHGGSNNAWTDVDFTAYHASFGAIHLPQVLEMEADRLMGLRLSQEDLDRERAIVAEELRVRVDNEVFVKALEGARTRLLGNHPYGHPTAGTLEDLGSIELEDCRAFYRRYYRPDNVLLVVVAPQPLDELEALTAAAFGKRLTPDEAPPDWRPEALSSQPPRTFKVREDLPAKVAFHAFYLPGREHKDHAALTVMRALLTNPNTRPLHHILVRRREVSLYADLVGFDWRRGSVLAAVSVSLPHRRNKTALRHLHEALTEVGGFRWSSEEGVRLARAEILRRRLARRYQPLAFSRDLAEAMAYQGGARAYFDFEEALEQVDQAAVSRVYRRYLSDGSQGLFLPSRPLLLLRAFGWLYPLVR